jgi:hypothetical protein
MEKKTKDKRVRTTVVTSADDEIISSKNKKRKLSSEKRITEESKTIIKDDQWDEFNILCQLTKFYLSHHF